MRDSITSIPISEAFEPKQGCPFCRMRNMLEDRVTEFITGAAMMEPEIRIETNKTGFCHEHYSQMLKLKNRLGIALILETHLASLEKNIFGGISLGNKYEKQGKTAKERLSTCFVCDKVNSALDKMISNSCNLWEKDTDFKKLFAEQEFICLEHFSELSTASKGMAKKNQAEFLKAVSELSHKYISSLKGDVTHFTKMFDYRNGGKNADWGNSRDAIERTIEFLTTRKP